MDNLFIALGWLVLSFLVGMLIGKIIKFGRDSDE
jgi:hypothetical protein